VVTSGVGGDVSVKWQRNADKCLNVPIENCGRMKSGSRAGREDHRWKGLHKARWSVSGARQGKG
jgi:hypothetical protein